MPSDRADRADFFATHGRPPQGSRTGFRGGLYPSPPSVSVCGSGTRADTRPHTEWRNQEPPQARGQLHSKDRSWSPGLGRPLFPDQPRPQWGYAAGPATASPAHRETPQPPGPSTRQIAHRSAPLYATRHSGQSSRDIGLGTNPAHNFPSHGGGHNFPSHSRNHVVIICHRCRPGSSLQLEALLCLFLSLPRLVRGVLRPLPGVAPSAAPVLHLRPPLRVLHL